MERKTSNKINMFKIHEDIHFDELDFKSIGYDKEYEDLNKKLFVQKTKFSSPQWLQYLQNLLSNSSSILNATSSFILLCKHNRNIYAPRFFSDSDLKQQG